MPQKTFTLIPHGASNGAADSPTRPSPARPMTSKQVRKAYKAANRMPQISRAERIRQEKAEQERIRKELEKEKAAAKAKAVREKKKAKEMAEMAEKKRNRLPLVRVRPSQDTIARFVRGNGSGIKRDFVGVPLETAIEEDGPAEMQELLQESMSEESPAHDTRVPEAKTVAEEIRRCHSISPRRAQKDTQEGQVPGEVQLPNLILDDDVGLTEKQEGCSSNSVDAGPAAPLIDTQQHQLNAEVGFRSDPGLISEDDFELDMLDELGELDGLNELLSENHKHDDVVGGPLKSNSDTEAPLLAQKLPRKPTPIERNLGLHTSSPKPALASPVKLAGPEKYALWESLMPSASPPREAPPLSTQAILCNLDDFFPTSSQQARELEEETDIGIGTPQSHQLHLSLARESGPTTEARPRTRSQSQHDCPQQRPSQSYSQSKPQTMPQIPNYSKILAPYPSGSTATEAAQPRRFFTSSGSSELLSLAIHRSRRTAALEELHQKERMRADAGIAVRQEKATAARKTREEIARANAERAARSRAEQAARVEARRATKANAQQAMAPRKRQILGDTAERITPPSKAPRLSQRYSQRLSQRTCNQSSITPKTDSVVSMADKENALPQKPPCGLSDSQETEYGGDWVDDIVMELMI